MSRAEPAEIRLPLEALLTLPWPRAAHLAIVDAVEHGWDTPHRWVAATAKTSKASAARAAQENLRAGIYDSARTVTKTTRDGTRIESTVYKVNRDWSTRGRSKRRKVFIRVDKRFLAANPRAGDLTKRLYHLIAFEQWRDGACALTPSALADLLGVKATPAQTPAARVYEALRSLRRRGEVERTPEGYLTAPHYEYAPPDPPRLKADQRRSSAAARRRAELSLGTSSPVTGNQLPGEPEPPNDSERLRTTLRAERVGEEERDEHRGGDATNWQEGKAVSEDDAMALLPGTAAALEGVFGYIPTPLARDLVTSLRLRRTANDDEPLNATQLEIIDNATATRLTALSKHSEDPRELFRIVRAALKAAAGDDELRVRVKQIRRRFAVDLFPGISLFRAVET
jgi:hypothetical protein